MSHSDQHGRFCWYELMTTDTAAAEAFYTRLIGWGTQPMDMHEMPYTMWTNGETPVGGLMTLPDEAAAAGAPPNWMAYIAVDDIEATTKQAQDLGATLMCGPRQIPGAGSFAVLNDPQGAVFALYHSNKPETPREGPPGLKEFSWHELLTTDYQAGLAFYSELFGWVKHETMDMGPAGIYQIYGRDEKMPLGGMFTKTDDMPGPPYWLYYVDVEDMAESIKLVEELGGKIYVGPFEVPGGSLVTQCADPQGAAFALHAKKADS